MPTFEIEANGEIFEVEAPDQQSAVAAFQQFSDGGAGAMPLGPIDLGDPMRAQLPAGMPEAARDVPNGYTPSMVPFLDPINAFANKAVESIPVAGPALSGFANDMDARFASMIEGKPVTAAERAQINQSEQSQYPAASTAGAVAGTVAPLVALGTTQAGAKMLGMAGNMGQRMLMGGVSGLGIGSADTAARGGSADEIITTGGRSALVGGAFPFAERVVSSLVRALMGKGVPREAQVLARSAGRDKLDPAQIMQQIEQMGPDAVLADLGPNMTRQAGAIASLPGEGQTILRDALVRRQQGANARIQGDVDATLGPSTTPTQFAGGIKDQQRQLSPVYEEAFTNARAVDSAPVALDLDSIAVNERGEAQTVARQLRDMLNVHGTKELDPNPRTLFAVRKAIDGMFDTVHDGNARRVLSETRKKVDGMLTDAVPGIKEVDAQFASLAKQQEAFDTGQTLLDSGRTAMRPQEVDALVNQAPADFLNALTQGTRAEIDRIIGTTANNVTALKSAMKGDGSWNRDRLVSLFGKEKAEKLLGVMEREMTFQRTYQTVTQNSETAARAAAQKDVSPANFGERPTGLLDVLLRLPQMGANAAARTRSEAVNSKLAEALMSRPGPEMVDQLIAAGAARKRGIVVPAAPALLAQPERHSPLEITVPYGGASSP